MSARVEPGSLLDRWLEAREAGDDRAAIDRGLRLLEAGRCPAAVWLTLPGCWQRARGLDDLGDFVDSLAERPGTPGGERALLVVAAARLHPAALATTDAHPAELLLLAAALAAGARGALDEAARLLPLCAPPRREPDLLGRLLRAEAALVDRAPPAPWARLPAPPGPPSAALAARIARTLHGRAGRLAERGRLLPALGLAELALGLAAGGPLRRSLLAQAARLRARLAEPARARALLDEALALADGPAARAPLRLAQADALLEEDQPALAASLARQALDEGADPARAHLALGIALAAQDHLDEAAASLREALALAGHPPDPPPVALPHGASEAGAVGGGAIGAGAVGGEGEPDVGAGGRGEVVAAGLHWLGLLAALGGDHARAEGMLRRSLGHHPALPGHPDLAPTLTALGASLAAQGRHDEAARRFAEAELSLERSLGPDHPRAQVAASCLSDLAAWRDALALERALVESPPDAPELVERLRRFPGYILLRSRSSRALLTASQGGLAAGAVVFTAPDLAGAFLAQAPPALRMDLHYMTVTGADLPAHLRRHGSDGALLNAAHALPLARWEG